MRTPVIKLEGDTTEAARWISLAKSKLGLLWNEVKLGGISQRWRKVSLDTADIYLSVNFENSYIRIIGKGGYDFLFISDSEGMLYGGWGDKPYAPYGVKKFGTKGFPFQGRMDYGKTAVYPRIVPAIGYIQHTGVSYYKKKVYVVDQNGWLDVFKETGEHILEVELWDLPPLPPELTSKGKLTAGLRVRGDKIYICAGYAGIHGAYEIHEYDLEFNFIRIFEAHGHALGVETLEPVVSNNSMYSGASGYYVGDKIVINKHELDTGTYLGNVILDGTEGELIRGMGIFKKILYVGDIEKDRIIRINVDTDAQMESIDYSAIKPPSYSGGYGFPLQWNPSSIVVGDLGIYVTFTEYFHREIPYLYHLSHTGDLINKIEGKLLSVTRPDTNPPQAYGFHYPGWMDIKNSENK